MRRACGTAAVAVCGGISFLSTGCSTVPFVNPVSVDGGFLIPLEVFTNKPSVIIKRILAPSIVVHRSDSGDYTALLMRCTHKACRPMVFEYSLDCPCHGSRFDFDGRVLAGPAQTDLESFPVSLDGEGNLLISLQQ